MPQTRRELRLPWPGSKAKETSEMLTVGERVPDVTLTGPEGREVRLRDQLGARGLVIYFYPKDDTPGCTAEACGFRDQYEDFLEAGADVIGISGDPPSSHKAFANKHSLPFRLLSDERGEARRAFGVKATFGLLPGRATFVVDHEGTIRYAFSSQLRAREHVKRALEVVGGMTPQAAAQK
ncbi:peroxiredoxin [Vulgatibacter incomptus]|uniref:thioredoxin-dependent peroxiredoxin n=1 Tax=Vulgatibacter incomptus TaxID=1391653 RepID=A0A0K1PB52_9BACT|nr:peroxiredoxin [Vulgatibacter incomptus]AKU90758.1 Alkyl hydroperoxide reductase subunit C-like protein [Vulgatibacter incomptus]